MERDREKADQDHTDAEQGSAGRPLRWGGALAFAFCASRVGEREKGRLVCRGRVENLLCLRIMRSAV